MSKLFAASMVNLHICLIGKTGIGKTSCAREFSRIRKKSMKLSKDFYMHSFHSNTKPSHFYGNITMKNNDIEFINGSLLNAMEEGTTFIADEMNLSPKIIMKSIVPSLDWNFNKRNIFISGGGINDRKLKFWNRNSFECIKEIETDSQICDIKFSEISNEFISTHGYNTFAINVWKINNDNVILSNSLIGHKNRVLFLANSLI